MILKIIKKNRIKETDSRIIFLSINCRKRSSRTRTEIQTRSRIVDDMW